MRNRRKSARVGQIHEGETNPTHTSPVPTRVPRSQLCKLTHKLMSHFNLHYNHLALRGGGVDSYCQKSVKTFSHLSCHELSKAWRERESGD